MLPISPPRAIAPRAAWLLHPEQPENVRFPGEPGLGQLRVGLELVLVPELPEPWRPVTEPRPRLVLWRLGLWQLVVVLQLVPGSALDLETAGDWSDHMAVEAERADIAVVDTAVGAEVADTVDDTEPGVVHKATEAADTEETEVVAAKNLLHPDAAVDPVAASPSPSPSDTPDSPAALPL